MTNNYLIFFIFFVLIACNNKKTGTKDTQVSMPSEQVSMPSEKDQFLVIDIDKKYPKSDRICIQDIADVEYIPLETNKDFLCDGIVSYIDDSIIIYANNGNGDILIFDRQGKAKYKINRKGQSREEYFSLSSILYDKDKNELYVNDMMLKKIVVYDIEGHYKRSFRHLQGTQYNCIYLFSDSGLLCYNNSSDGFEKDKCPFKIVSKQNGKLIKELNIPFSKRISNRYSFIDGNNTLTISTPLPEPAVKMGDKWILNEISSDTIYQLLNDFSLTPLMAQTPSVQSMGENPKYLGFVLDSYHYQFLFIQKKDYDKTTQTGYPTTYIMYNKSTGKISEQNFYDVNMSSEDFEFVNDSSNIINGGNKYLRTYKVFRLKDFLDKNKLTGQLKEITEQINEDDNPVLMIITFKKL